MMSLLPPPPIVPPRTVVVSIAPERGTSLFRVTLSNPTSKTIAVCRYDYAWRLELFRGSRKITDEEAYIAGGTAQDGTLYYPPHLLLQMPVDWVALRYGEEASFLRAGMRLGGAVTDTSGVTKAVVRLLPKELEPPSWIDVRGVEVLRDPVTATWEPRAKVGKDQSASPQFTFRR